jgi:hypothetical protein
LQSEVVEIFLVGASDQGFEHNGAHLIVSFMGAFSGKFMAAQSVVAGF